jgi:hypothetical protein
LWNCPAAELVEALFNGINDHALRQISIHPDVTSTSSVTGDRMLVELPGG